MDPLIPDAMLAEEYRTIAYSRYRDLQAGDLKKYADAYGRLIDPHLRVEKAWHCLDVACGRGNFLAFLRSKGVVDYMGVDITPPAVECAAREFGSEHVVNQSVDAFLRARDSSYDLISALDFIEHIKKDELVSFLGSVARKLEPSGYLLIRTPNASAPFGMAARYNDVTHETCFTCDSLADFTARFGFDVVGWWDDIGHPGSLLQACHWFLWKLLCFSYKVLDSVEMGRWTQAPMTRNFWILFRRNTKKAT